MSGTVIERPRSLVASFVNAEDGIESWVIARSGEGNGYSVVLMDTDSGCTCSAVLFYPLIRDAIGKAIALSGIYTV